MNRSSTHAARGRRTGPGAQRGFFDAGLGLALLALFSLASAAMVTHEADDAGQRVASCATARADADCDRH